MLRHGNRGNFMHIVEFLKKRLDYVMKAHKLCHDLHAYRVLRQKRRNSNDNALELHPFGVMDISA